MEYLSGAGRPNLDLLREWAEWAGLRRAGEPVPLPTVTLHLRSGQGLRGIVQHVTESAALYYLVLEGDNDFSYIPAAAVEAITVHGYGRDQPVETAPAPLQYRRDLEAWELVLRDAFASPIAVSSAFDSESLAALDSLRVRLAAQFDVLAAGPQAHKAVAAGVRAIQLRTGPAPSVTLSNGTLVVTTTRIVADRMLPDRLRSAIEAVL